MQIDTKSTFKGIYVDRKKTCILGDMLGMHSHVFNELNFLNSGKRTYVINGNTYDVTPGDLVILPKNVPHKATSTDYHAGYDRHAIYFDDAVIERLKTQIDEKLIQTFMNSECFTFNKVDTMLIKQKLDQIDKEKVMNDMYTPIAIENLLSLILILTMRTGKKKALRENADFGQMHKAIKYINENYAKNITLESTARILLLEKTYFSRKFKQATGVGFKEFLIRTRVKKAEDLLAYPELKISEVAEQCGFSSTNYFGDCFKKINGISPRQYRELF